MLPQIGTTSAISIKRNENTGMVYSKEWGDQTYIGEDGLLKTQDGETIDENRNVISTEM